jgi:glutaredoxin
MTDIVIYHGDGCHACHEEMTFLEQAGVDFVARNVSRDREALRELIAMGSRTVPTTRVGDAVVIGFEPARLKELLEL